MGGPARGRSPDATGLTRHRARAVPTALSGAEVEWPRADLLRVGRRGGLLGQDYRWRGSEAVFREPLVKATPAG